MANKAVVGAFALGVGLHQVNEWRKDRNVEMERIEREQLEQDRLDEKLHRERQQKEHQKKKNRHKNQAGLTNGEMFSRSVDLLIEKELNETIRTAGDLATIKARQFEALKLPLLGKDPTSQDFKLAVALAFGYFDSIEDLKSQTSFKHRLGAPLVTLSRYTVQIIIKHIKSKKASRPLDLGQTLEQGVLNTCAFLAARTQKIENREPFVQLYDYMYSRDVAKRMERYGFFLTPLDHFECDMSSCGLYMTFRPTRTKGFVVDNESLALLTNFEGIFQVPIKPMGDSEMLDLDRLDFSKATLSKRLDKRKIHITSPNIESLSCDYGLMQSRVLHETAASRLEYLLSRMNRDQELSLQHIAMYSGYEGTLLQEMEDADKHIIAENKASLGVALHSTLQACVLPVKNQDVPTHQSEIRHFVQSYLRLLQLSYCKTPILGNGPPSHYVPKKSVVMEANEMSVWVSDGTMFHGTRRLREKLERDKIDEARILSKPKPFAAAMVGSFLFILIAWLVYIVVYKMALLCSPHSTLEMVRITSLVTTAPFVLYTMRSLVQLLQYPLRLAQSGNNTNWRKTLEALTEVIVRHGCIQMGFATPFENELETLTKCCNQQHEEWISRIAIEEFERARKRKKIGYSNFLLLTNVLKDTVYKSINENGNQHGEKDRKGPLKRRSRKNRRRLTKSKVEELKKIIKVTGGYGMPQTLSEASSILEPFVCKDEEDSGPPSKLSIFKSVETIAEECLKFDVGDRVSVDLPSEDGTEELPEAFSSDAIAKLSTDLEEFKSLNGSIAGCHSCYCFIHFDGMPEVLQVPIPLSWVSPLDESRTNTLLRKVFGGMIDMDDEAMVHLGENQDEGASTAEIDQNEETDDEDIENESVESKPLVVGRQDRPSTLEDALVQGQWTLVRQRNHYVYKRALVLPNDANEGHGGTVTQTVVLAKTSSDRRSARKAMRTFRRKDEEKEALSATILPKLG